MSGWLPGVGVAARRRPTINHHRLEDHPPIRSSEPSSIREIVEPWATIVDMDETALRARQRLEQRLGYLRPPSRSQNEGGRGRNHIARLKDSGLGSKILGGRPWQFNTSKSEREVCAVCLEDFRTWKQVMDLSCSHKYHSKCLRPWLAAHPHCPYCRTPVQF